MVAQGLTYFVQSDSDGKPLLSIRAALALDLFCQCYNAESFEKRPLNNGDISSILEDCLKAADVLLDEDKE